MPRYRFGHAQIRQHSSAVFKCLECPIAVKSSSDNLTKRIYGKCLACVPTIGLTKISKAGEMIKWRRNSAANLGTDEPTQRGKYKRLSHRQRLPNSSNKASLSYVPPGIIPPDSGYRKELVRIEQTPSRKKHRGLPGDESTGASFRLFHDDHNVPKSVSQAFSGNLDNRPRPGV
jgi:hypothetical protein